MGRSRLPLVAALSCLALFAAGSSVAQASHTVPLKADKSSAALVTAYSDCASPSINDPSLGPGNNACPAVDQNPHVRFGGSGSAKLATARVAAGKSIKDIGGKDLVSAATEANPTGDVTFKFTQKGFDFGFGAQSPAGADLSFVQQNGLTDSGCTNGPDCFVLFSTSMVYPRWPGSPDHACVAGRCAGLFTLNTAARALEDNLVLPFDNTETSNAVNAGLQASFSQGPTCMSPDDPAPPPGLPGDPDDWYGFHACEGILVGKASDDDPANYDRPARASRLQLAYVPAFAPVLGNPRDHQNPYMNFPAYEVSDAASIAFGAKGKGSAKLTAGKSPTGGEVKVSATFKDVRSGASYYSGPISLRFPVRVTHAACAGNSVCTRPIQNVGVDGVCANGSCRVSSTTSLNLPAERASNVQIGILDQGENQLCGFDGPASSPTAKPFACPGIYVP